MMHIKVLQHHIDRGTPHSPHSCAVALAVLEQYPDAKNVSIGFCIGIGDQFYVTPNEVHDWIVKFDDYQHVEPFEFELREPS